MTVASETNRSGPYHGNGVTTSFEYKFKIVDASHLNVVLRDNSANERTLVLNTDYTVSGVGDELGGEISTTVAPATGEDLTILRNVPFVQETDLENQGAYYAETVEDAFDLLTMQTQQLKEKLDRAVTMPENLDPSGLSDLVADIIRLGDSADNIDIVADNVGDVNTVAGSIANVNTVANNIAAVNTVAANIEDVNTVASISGNVNTVAGDHDEIVALAAITGDINTVAGIAADVTEVSSISGDVQTVAANIADVTNFADVYLGPKDVDPATRNDGSSLQAADMYFNTTTDQLKVFDGSAWQSVTDQSLNMHDRSFSGDGSSTEYVLDLDPVVARNVLVWVGGVRQKPGVDYTVSGTTLTLAAAPGVGVAVDTLVIATTSKLYAPADGSVIRESVSDELQPSVPYSVKEFGAVGDGAANDRQSFIDADTNVPEGYEIIVPAGSYSIGTGDLNLSGRRFRFDGQVSITGGRLLGAVIEQVDTSNGSKLFGTGVGDASMPAVANYKFGRVLNNMFRKGLQIGGADPSETPDGTVISLDSQIGWPVVQPTRWGNAVEFAVQSNARSWRGNITAGGDVVTASAPIFDATLVGKNIYIEDLIYRISEYISGSQVRVVNIDGSPAAFPYTKAVTIIICFVGGTGTATVSGATLTRVSGEPFVPSGPAPYYVKLGATTYQVAAWISPDQVTLNAAPGNGTYSYEWWTTINHLASRIVVQRANGLAGAEELVALEAYANGSFRLQALSSSGTFPFDQRPFHLGNGYNSDTTQRTHILLDGSLGSTLIGGGYDRYTMRVGTRDNVAGNALFVEGGSAGFPIALRSEGIDPDIDILIAPKGSGYVRMGQTIAGHATTGTPRSLFIKDQDGNLLRISAYQV